MAIKKPLEFKPAPTGEAVDDTEARFVTFGRKLEMKTSGGGIHKEFSHETGTVQVDKAGLDEFHAREQKDREERAVKAKEAYSREHQKLQTFMAAENSDVKWGEKMAVAEGVLRYALMFAAAFFGITGLAELYYLSTGAARPDNFGGWTWLGFVLCVALTATILHTKPTITRIVGRFVYSGVLIYLGLTGLWGLLRTFSNPERFGGSAISFGLAFVSVVIAVAAFQYLLRKRRRLLELYDEPEHEWIRAFPALGNRNVLDNLLYTVEAAMATLLFSVLFTLFTRLDALTFIFMALAGNPWLLLIYAYPFCGYFAARKVIASLR